MSRHRSFRRWLAAVLAAVLIISVAGIVPAGAAPPRDRGLPKRAPRAATASKSVLAAKLDDKLIARIDQANASGAGADALVDIAVLAPKQAGKPGDMVRPVRMVLRGDPDNDLWIGKAKVSKLAKIATRSDVKFVFDNGRLELPRVPDSGGVGLSLLETKRVAFERKAQLAAARTSGAIEEFRAQFDDEGQLVDPVAEAAYDGDSATGWYDVSPFGHDSTGAWDNGFTGTGVKVAVADDSCDFAHPDLMGTQAVVEDPSSPYFGWPQAFDPYSLLLYAIDSAYAETYVADGQSWFTDTSTVIGENGSFDGHALLTPGTSLSGNYHIGYLWDENLYYYGWGYPMVLVADTTAPGVYDTVYVDLDMDYDFNGDKPCTKSSPISYADWWGTGYVGGPDGYADNSGGMVYWIADGTNQPPGAEFLYPSYMSAAPGSGDMVCFMGALNVDEDHGTLCSSNVVGQGVTDGPSWDGDYPSFKATTGTGDGMVQGAGRDADLVAIADIYWDHFYSTLAAYDYAAFGLDGTPLTGDDVQVVSNSYGESGEDADGWDYRSRYVTYLNKYYNDTVTYLFSTGNGAPGYGTTAPPSPATGIAVGASTQLGACGGWDSIADADQVTVGDVIPWSNRGPSAAGGLAPDIVADGAYSSGAVPINMYSWDGWTSWEVWGGTSRSCPVAAGNLSLVYDAYKQETGDWPTYALARQFLMNGAVDLNYDTLVQGAGMVNAARATSIANDLAGLGVSPASWSPGDFQGEEYESFAKVVHPGDDFTTNLTITNTGSSPVDVDLSDAWYQRSSTITMSVTLDGSSESAYDFNRPDYLLDITSMIPADTDLMVVRGAVDAEDFAPTGAVDLSANHNVARLLAYDWKDRDSSGDLWTDTNANGYVNTGEIDATEYMRFTYLNNFANTSEIRVQRPLDRMHDGVFLGLQHQTRYASDPTVRMELEISFWDRADMPWLSVNDTLFSIAAEGTQVMPVHCSVPADAPLGVYEGEFRVSDGSDVTVVPVVINVGSQSAAFDFGDVPGALETLMPNDRVFGTQSWGWRAESGDWRFFMTDTSADAPLPDGAAWLTRTSWEDLGAAEGQDTDIDTLLYGPSADDFSDFDPSIFGPSGLGLKAGSANTNVGAGLWNFQTNTGTTEEWIAGPLQPGLNQIMLHNVVYDGKQIGERFNGQAGIISVAPSAIDIVSSDATGSSAVDFATYTMPLSGAAVESYGLTRKVQESFDIATGEEVNYDLTLTDAAYLDVQTACEGQDIDLYVYLWDDVAVDWILVGASESSSGEERVRLERPVDGAYLVNVYGYSVSGSQPFDLAISSPMGDELALTGTPVGAIDAGDGFTLDVDWSKDRTALTDREGTYEGIIYLGPTEAPGAIAVPVTLRYPFEIEHANPADGATLEVRPENIEVQFSKRIDVDTLADSVTCVKNGTEPVSGGVGYNDAMAYVAFNPDEPFEPGAEYELRFDGVTSVDGDMLDQVITFTTDYLLRAAGDDRYATAVEASQMNFAAADTVILATGKKFPDALSSAGLAGALDAPLLLTGYSELPASVAAEIQRLGASQVIMVGGTAAISDAVEDAVDALPGVSVERVFGADRYATAAEVARRIAEETGAALPDTCFLARGDQFPDALAVSPFAYSATMPILLTRPTAMPAATADVIDELGFTQMVVAGGTSAVSDAAAAQSGLPASAIHRASGPDRYATAAAVAEYGVAEGWGDWSFLGIATGANFPDGLAGGVVTGANGGVLLLTPSTSLSAYTSDAIEANVADILEIQIFGGSAAVSDDVQTAIAGLF